MDNLWAPWRIKYIVQKKERGCVFCQAIKTPKKDFVIFTNKYSGCMLNIYPYNNGHVMVFPKRHVAGLDELKGVEVLELFNSLVEIQKRLQKCLKAQGFNIGINLGQVSGAGIPGHLHIHLVPRWTGDTNFMPVVFKTKVISQSLEELFKLLKVNK
ncbi:MAG: HIT domain-containing protein [Candidatus Omnitrophota bacterium]|nr:HIT domain-containing protein [Candidatus Omnitrophota bacterium]